MNPQTENGGNAHTKSMIRRRWVRGKGLSTYSPVLRICKDCGVPLDIAHNHIWEEHGRILSRDTEQRLIIVERKILTGILTKIADKVGEDIEKTFIYAKAFDASEYVRSMMIGWRKIAAAYPLVKRPFYNLLCDSARVLGLADAEVREYRRGKKLVISCTQCYSKTFFAGDILGAVYAGENREVAVRYGEEDGEIVYTVTVTENEHCSEIEKYSFSWEVPLPGYISYKRCKRCGIPFSVSFFSWDISRGLMVDTHNGEPVALVDVAGMNAAYSEVRERYGEWIDDFICEETKKMVDEILPGLEWKRRRPEERIRDLFFLAYRGMGNPVFTEPIKDGIRARVENPFNYPIVAGIAASFLAKGKPVALEWERSIPGRLEMEIHFL